MPIYLTLSFPFSFFLHSKLIIKTIKLRNEEVIVDYLWKRKARKKNGGKNGTLFHCVSFRNHKPSFFHRYIWVLSPNNNDTLRTDKFFHNQTVMLCGVRREIAEKKLKHSCAKEKWWPNFEKAIR